MGSQNLAPKAQTFHQKAQNSPRSLRVGLRLNSACPNASSDSRRRPQPFASEMRPGRAESIVLGRVVFAALYVLRQCNLGLDSSLSAYKKRTCHLLNADDVFSFGCAVERLP